MRKPIWEIRQAAQPRTLEIYIYGDVEGDRYDWWTDEVIESETSANHFREELGRYPDAGQINLYINSYGGSVFEGTAIYNQLKRHPAHKTAYIDGFACSIASVIAMAADEIVMPRNALMMIHNMWMVAAGNAAQLRKAADDLEIMNEAGRAAYLEKAGDKLTPEALERFMDDETWLTAEECIRLGLADRYAEKDADMGNALEVVQKANLRLEQQLKLHRSLSAQVRQVTAEEPPVQATENPKEEPAEEPAEGEKKSGGVFALLGGI